jgi:hypothetical protein
VHRAIDRSLKRQRILREIPEHAALLRCEWRSGLECIRQVRESLRELFVSVGHVASWRAARALRPAGLR